MITTILTTLFITTTFLIKGFLLASLITNFEPMQEYIDKKLTQYFDKNEFNEKNIKHNVLNYFYVFIQCRPCLSFWITLILSFNIYIAITAYLVVKKINKLI